MGNKLTYSSDYMYHIEKSWKKKIAKAYGDAVLFKSTLISENSANFLLKVKQYEYLITIKNSSKIYIENVKNKSVYSLYNIRYIELLGFLKLFLIPYLLNNSNPLQAIVSASSIGNKSVHANLVLENGLAATTYTKIIKYAVQAGVLILLNASIRDTNKLMLTVRLTNEQWNQYYCLDEKLKADTEWKYNNIAGYFK